MKKKRVNAYLKTFNNELRLIKGETSVSLSKDLQKLLESGKILNAALPHLVRLECYKKHIQELSDNILGLMNEIVVPYINDFDEKSISKIKTKIRETFQTLEGNAGSTEKTFAAIRGGKYNAPMAIGVISQEYRLSLDKFLLKVDSALERGSLKETMNKEKKIKERLTDLTLKVVTYIITFILGTILGYLYHKYFVN